MFKAHYFYFKQTVPELEKMVEAHQLDFDALIMDTFTENEIEKLDHLIDSIAAVFVQPIISELSFEDFYPDEKLVERQRFYFESCKSSICLENLPELQENPFQVTYINELLRNFDEVLIDTGGTNILKFKKDYLEDIKRYKNIFSLLPKEESKPIEIKTTRPVDPIDFLILDVYKELDRLKAQDLSGKILDLPDKTKKAFSVMKSEKLVADELLRKSGLNPKDLDDHLEKLKFFLRKI